LAGIKGYGTGKPQGQKRHLLADTPDLILAVVVTAASARAGRCKTDDKWMFFTKALAWRQGLSLLNPIFLA